MFLKIIILCAVSIAACASVIGSAGLGSPAIAYGAYGIGEKGSIVPVDSAPHGYIENGGIDGYRSSSPVEATPIGYYRQEDIGGRRIDGYGSSPFMEASLIGHLGQGKGSRRIGGYGNGATMTIGTSAGIVRRDVVPYEQHYINV